MMQEEKSHRRSFLRIISVSATAYVAGVAASPIPPDTVRVPWSSGTAVPLSQAPVNATDCHHHIYDSRFPMDSNAKLRPGDATVSDYRLLQKRIGTTRNVIVQPSTYGVDNRCMLDALRQFGYARTRGIAVVNTEISDSALKELHAAGVRGIRFNLVQAGATTMEMVGPLSRRVADMGWHIQINASAEQILAGVDIWKGLPVPLVVDHLGHVSAEGDHTFNAIAQLIQRGKCWVKLSGAYMDTNVGPPTYLDRGTVARAYIKEAPERLVWGTDWPHPTATDKPDDALLFDLLAQWCSSEAVRKRILVDNPATLYGFE